MPGKLSGHLGSVCPEATSLSSVDVFAHTPTPCVGSLWSLESGFFVGGDTEGPS